MLALFFFLVSVFILIVSVVSWGNTGFVVVSMAVVALGFFMSCHRLIKYNRDEVPVFSISYLRELGLIGFYFCIGLITLSVLMGEYTRGGEREERAREIEERRLEEELDRAGVFDDIGGGVDELDNEFLVNQNNDDDNKQSSGLKKDTKVLILEEKE